MCLHLYVYINEIHLSTTLFFSVHNKVLYDEKGDRRGTVVKVLCYKSEGRWFDPSWCH